LIFELIDLAAEGVIWESYRRFNFANPSCM